MHLLGKVERIEESDWLATQTFFFNSHTGKISQSISEVINFANFEWNWEGLENYLSIGYSVLGETPVKNVKFLQANSHLVKDKKGQLTTFENYDKEQELLGKLEVETQPAEVVELLRSKIVSWERKTDRPIILPLSGGYDSRFIFSALQDKKRLHCFTYGLSADQAKSLEVVRAKSIVEAFDTNWTFVALGAFNEYLDSWYQVFGCSTHAHGMYHIEFYEKIRTYLNRGAYPFVSGLIGDAWAGNVQISQISTPSDIAKLGYSHGLRASPEHMVRKNKSNHILEKYFEQKKHLWKSSKYRVVESMRMKMMLLKYLMVIPREFDFEVFAPFIEEESALAMHNLSNEQKQNRKWQADYFESVGLDIENRMLEFDNGNTLNSQSLKHQRIPLLSEKLLGEIISPNYVAWINKNLLNTAKSKFSYRMNSYLKGKRLVHRLAPKDNHLEAYFAYLVLNPLQKLIEERNSHTS
ncbi:MAG: asparagine synthase-related protein [Bacteroidota bacterium]